MQAHKFRLVSTNVVLRLQFFFFLLASKSSFFTQRSKIRFGTNCAETPSTKKRRRKRHKHTYLRNYVCIAKLNLYRRESCLGEKRDATVRFVFSCSEYVIRARANVNPFFFSSLPSFPLGTTKTRRFVGKGEIEARRRVALSSSLLSESGKSNCLSVSSSFAKMRSPISFRPFWCLCLTISTHLSFLFKTNRSKASTKKISAKYGDESVYFDLGDVESTTGSWDVYGVESTARYPDQQAKFFENAAQGLGRREAMYSFLALSGGAACLVFGGKGSKDAKLPITIGPQKEAVKGPRDRL